MRTPAYRWHIAYDIAHPRRLRRVERALSAVGHRVHESLFCCELQPAELLALQRRVVRCLDLALDVVRYVPLCAQDDGGSMHLGAQAGAGTGLAAAWIV